MTYLVSATPAAEADAEDYVRWIAVENNEPASAARWLDGLLALYEDLRTLPTKYAVLPEELGFSRPLRQAHYHSHRIIFTIDEEAKEVVVLRVFHGARRLKPNHLAIAQED